MTYKYTVIIDPFMITEVLHSSGAFVSWKMMILQKKLWRHKHIWLFYDVILHEGYNYHSHMSQMNAGPQLSWTGL